MKESWKTINQVVNKRSKSTNIDLLKGPGREIVNRQEISNTMNEYFCSVGKDLARKIEDAPNPMLTGKYNLNPDNKRFNFRPIVVQDIRDAMGKIKTSKSLGSDNIPSYFLKLATPYIENALVFMFNTSLETSHFPDCWKTARITPIFKEGDRAERSNYRPISVLPVISRLFEKLVFNQLYEYLVKNKLIHPGQSGFLKLHSTSTCLLKNTDDWYSGFMGWTLDRWWVQSSLILKRHLTQSTTTFSAKSLNTTVFSKGNCLGFSLISLTENSSAEWVGSIQELGSLK